MRSISGLLLAMMLPALLISQGVRGSVIERETGRAIPNPLVRVQDSTGATVAQVVGDTRGAFLVQLETPGRYQLRIAAIGYAPVRSDFIEIGREIVAAPEIRLESMVASLSDVVVAEQGGRCRPDRATGERMARVLDAAATSMAVMRGALAADAGTYRTRIVSISAFPTRRDTLFEADTVMVTGMRWPLLSAGGDTLQRRGFAFETAGSRQGSWLFLGPGPETLFAEWFMASHCFAAAPERNDSSTLVVTFTPAADGSSRVDVAGRLLLDARTLALGRIEFEHVNLPGRFSRGVAGGAVDFGTTGEGVWLPTRWHLWAPIEAPVASPPGVPLPGETGRGMPQDPRVIGRKEVRGEVVGSP